MSVLLQLEAATLDLVSAVDAMTFAAPVAHVYNPLRYASANYLQYLQRFSGGPKRAIFLGMNPGPYGMAQTGIPFGDVVSVGEWMGLREPLCDVPTVQHAKRPIVGLSCARVEVSGKRLWGAIRDTFGTPEAFFADYFVANYCPLAFMEDSGRNRTPDKLAKGERKALYAVCDSYLRALVDAIQPQWVIGIGRFAEMRARAALETEERAIRGDRLCIGRITHPSPANPAANRGWADCVKAELCTLWGCEG